MRTLTAREAGHYVGRLERVATELENNYDELNLSREAALRYAYEIDQICDQIEHNSRQAKLLEGDPAGIYDSFDDAPGWMEGREENPDQTYMETFNYQGGGVHPTQGSGTSVSERSEPPIQELSEYADGFRKQPSQPHVKSSSRLFNRGRYVRQTR